MSIARYKKQGGQYVVEMFAVVRGRVISLGRFTADTMRELNNATDWCDYVVKGG